MMMRGIRIASVLFAANSQAFCQQLQREQYVVSPVEVSPQTTHLTTAGPLKFPDYPAYFDALDSRGVTAENNAAELLIPIMREWAIQSKSRCWKVIRQSHESSTHA